MAKPKLGQKHYTIKGEGISKRNLIIEETTPRGWKHFSIYLSADHSSMFFKKDKFVLCDMSGFQTASQSTIWSLGSEGEKIWHVTQLTMISAEIKQQFVRQSASYGRTHSHWWIYSCTHFMFSARCEDIDCRPIPQTGLTVMQMGKLEALTEG